MTHNFITAIFVYVLSGFELENSGDLSTKSWCGPFERGNSGERIFRDVQQDESCKGSTNQHCVLEQNRRGTKGQGSLGIWDMDANGVCTIPLGGYLSRWASCDLTDNSFTCLSQIWQAWLPSNDGTPQWGYFHSSLQRCELEFIGQGVPVPFTEYDIPLRTVCTMKMSQGQNMKNMEGRISISRQRKICTLEMNSLPALTFSLQTPRPRILAPSNLCQ